MFTFVLAYKKMITRTMWRAQLKTLPNQIIFYIYSENSTHIDRNIHFWWFIWSLTNQFHICLHICKDITFPRSLQWIDVILFKFDRNRKSWECSKYALTPDVLFPPIFVGSHDWLGIAHCLHGRHNMWKDRLGKENIANKRREEYTYFWNYVKRKVLNKLYFF